VLLLNTDRKEAFQISAGDRIAQLLIVRAEGYVVDEVEELSASSRGDGGFGSSGA
jgi:dUTP pyrophosphatase